MYWRANQHAGAQMVAIVSGNSLGLNLTSLRTLGPQDFTGVAAHGRNNDGTYVNVATGNLVVQGLEATVAAHGEDISALRTYNSRGRMDDDNGDNWSNGFFRNTLEFAGTLNTAGSTIRKTDRDGSVALYTFRSLSEGYQTTDGDGAHDTIKLLGGEFIREDGSTGVKQTYEGSGLFRLLRSEDPTGNTLVYDYDLADPELLTAVRSGAVEGTFYTYADGNLESVSTKDAAGTVTTRVRYGYDARDRLETVTVDLSPEDDDIGDGKVYLTTYTYEGDSRRISTITQTDGTQLTFEYDDSSYEVTSVTDALGHATTFTYGDSFTDVESHLGHVTRYSYDGSGQLTGIASPSASGTSPSRTFEYESGNVTKVVDEMGRAVTFEYDPRGNQTLQRDSAGNVVTRTFDARNQLKAETIWTQPDPDGAGTETYARPQTTRYVYEEDGNNLLRFVISADGRVTQHTYDGFGARRRSITYTQSIYSSTGGWTEGALQTWADAQPAAAVQLVAYKYDARGELEWRAAYATVSALGQGETEGRTWERFIHDQSGRLLQSISGTGDVTNYVYDGLGRRTSIDAAGQVTTTDYRDAQRKTRITVASGLVSTSTYDAAGRLMTVVETKGAATLGTTTYVHDADNRLRTVIDPTQVSRWVLYDAAGRKTADIDGNRTMTEYRYDASGRITYSVTYATAVTASLEVGGADRTVGQVRPAVQPGDNRTWYAYDAAGRLSRTARSSGPDVAVTETRYDGASRVERVVQYATLLVPSVDPVTPGAIPAPAASEDDRVSRYFYDGDGHRIGSLDAEGYLVVFRYDAAGRQSERIAYAARTPAVLREAGTLAQLEPDAIDDADIRNVFFYDGQGRLVAEVDGEGYLTETGYDLAGRVNSIRRYRNPALGSVTPESRLSDIRPTATGQDWLTTRSHDAHGRLSREVNHEGTVTTYAYDEVGNLVSTTRAYGTEESRTTQVRYDPQGRIIAELPPVGVAHLQEQMTPEQVDAVWADFGVTHAYDAAGRRISTSDAHGHKTVFFYDEDGALRFQVNAMGDVQESLYDVQGRLAQRIGYVERISTADLTGGLDASLVTSRLPQGEASVSRTTFVYRRDGSLEKTIDPLGNIVLHGYNAFGEVVRTEEVNAASGNLVRLQERDRRGLVTRTTLDPAALELETSTEYDAFGRAVSTTDANGWTRAQAYDGLGRIVTRRDAFDNPRTTTYDAFGQVLTEVDAFGQTTTFTYNVVTRTVKVETPEQHVTTTVRNRHGEVSAFIDGVGNSTGYAYDAGGRTLEIRSPLGTTTRKAYDAAGLLRDEWDASGTRVHFDYDAADRLSSRTVDPGGLKLVTTYTYDGMGRQVTVTDPSGMVTKVDYDPGSRVLSRTVDSGGLNIKTQYSYDAADRVLTVTDPAGTVTLYGYDVAGRRKSECIDTGGLNLKKTWTYDGNDNVETATDANGNVTRYTYDRENRLTFTVIEGTGSVTRRIYDAAGNVVRRIAYATRLPAGSAPQDLPVTANDRITSMAYDGDGRLVFEVDALKGVVENVLDGNGRVVRRIAYANPIASVPELGQSATVMNLRQALVASPAEDRSTRYAYDATGRLVYTIDATGAVRGTEYRDSERTTILTRYARRIEVGGDWSEASVKAAVDATDLANQIETHRHDKAGRLDSTTDALGFTESYTYDASGHKKTFTNKKGDTWLYDYDGAGRLVKETSPALSLASISADGTMTRTQEGGRVITLLAYDGAGRLKSRTEAAGRAEERTTTYGYDAAGRQVSVRWDSVRVYDPSKDIVPVTQGLAARTEKAVRPETSTFYDALGNAVANIDIGGALSQKTYDAAGRLLYEVDALGYVTKYERNVFGEVIQLTRYAQATTLANRTVTEAADAVRTVTIEAKLSAEGVDHADDRFVATEYDRMGRVTQTREHSAFVFDPGAVAATEQTGNAAKSTQIVYNAFGEAVEVKALRNAVANAWSVTSNYYDGLGRQVGAVDALGHVTSRSYDVFGNLASTTEYARALAGPWTPALFQIPPSGAGDRTIRYGYDKGNRKVEETRVNVEYSTASDGTAVRGDLVSTFSYDAVGNQTVVIDPLNRRTTTYYDVLGRVAAVSSPRRSVVKADGALGSVNPLVKFFRDAHGNVIEQVEYANGSSELNGDAAVADAQLDRRTLTRYDGLGRALEVKDPLGASKYMSYDVHGNLAKQWQLVSGQTSYTVNVYDKVGQLVETRRPASTMRIQTGITAQLIRGPGYAPLAQDTLRLEWSTLLGDATGDVRVVVEYVAAAYTMTNSETEEQTTVPAVTRTVTQTGTAASAAGG